MDRGRCSTARRRRWTAGAAGAVVGLLLAAPAAAGAGVWTPIGPEAGVIGVLAVTPGEPRTIYALSSISGVFKTTDGGDSWASVDQGIDLATAYLVTVAVGPDGTVLAGGVGGSGIWRSVDGGATWQPSPPGPSFLPAWQFGFDPRDARIVHMAAGVGIYRSADGGVSWTPELMAPRTVPLSYFSTVAVAPGRPSVLFAGGNTGLYRSGDGGVSWRRALTSCIGAAVAFDPSAPARVYVGCGGAANGFPSRGGVMTSANGGVSWRPTALGPMPVSSLVVSPGTAGMVYAATGSGVFRSADRGAHWSQLRGLGAVNALAVSPLRHPVLFAGLPGQGVFRSADGGASWSAANRGLTGALVVALAADPTAGGRLYVGTDGAGAFSTGDAGASWKPIDRGLTNPLVVGLAVAPLAPSTLYARGGLTDVFVSTDAGQTWLNRSPPDSLQHSLLCGPFVDPRDPLHILLGEHDGAVGASSDGGSTWQDHQVAPGRTLIETIAFAPSDPAIVYASGSRFAAGTFKSIDGGVTWNRIGPPGFVNAVMAVDPNDPSTVYSSGGQGVHKTVDGGATWTLASPIPVGVTALALDPRLPGRVIAATGWPAATAVWISRDGGTTWTPLGSGLPSQLGVSALTFDASSPTTLYAATGFGVYELQMPTQDQ